MKTVYDIVHTLFSTYFQEFFKVAYAETVSLYFIVCYRNNLYVMQALILISACAISCK